MKKLTPVLVVDQVEPCAAFWTGALGFARTAEVPHDGEPGFVILQRDAVEIMYQSRASVAADVPQFATRAQGQANLYVEVDDLGAIERAVKGMKLAVAKRKTFYGAEEIGIQDPAGNVIMFAEMKG